MASTPQSWNQTVLQFTTPEFGSTGFEGYTPRWLLVNNPSSYSLSFNSPGVPNVLPYTAGACLPWSQTNIPLKVYPINGGNTPVNAQVTVIATENPNLTYSPGYSTNPTAVVTGVDATSLQGTPVENVAPTTGQLLQYNGTGWVPYTPNTAGLILATTYLAPAGQTPYYFPTSYGPIITPGYLSTGSFTVPPSGQVLVTATFTIVNTNTGPESTAIGLSLHGSPSTTIGLAYAVYLLATQTNGDNQYAPYTFQWLVSGRTPGVQEQYDLNGVGVSTGTAAQTWQQIVVAGFDASTGYGTGGPLSIVVQGA